MHYFQGSREHRPPWGGLILLLQCKTGESSIVALLTKSMYVHGEWPKTGLKQAKTG